MCRMGIGMINQMTFVTRLMSECTNPNENVIIITVE